MPGPTLRKIRNCRSSAIELARLIEMHVGPTPTEQHCVQALLALDQARNSQLSKIVRALNLLAIGSTPCERLRDIVVILRSNHYEHIA